MDRKKICWVTPDHFLDTDLMVVPYLLNSYDIHWLVIFYRIHRFKESDFDELIKQHPNLSVEFLYCNIPGKDVVRKFFSVNRLKRKILSIPVDLYYVNYVPTYPYHIQLFKGLPSLKTIFTAHDGSVKPVMRPNWLIRWSFKHAYKYPKYVNMFSRTQAELFEHNYPGPHVMLTHLGYKKLGDSTINKRTDCISFMAFGSLHEEKNVGLLIDAANQLYEEGERGFKVSINGVWQEKWDINERIKYPEIFEVSLGMVRNEDIPNLFGYNHYSVYPYKEMSQSGALKLAYGYHNPVICANLPGFVDEVEDWTDGYLFKSQDVNDLKRVMKKCICDGIEGYNHLREKMVKHVESKYSPEAISEQYISMLESVLKDNNQI